MLAVLNKRFRELVEDFHSFHQNEVIEKGRQEYEKGVFSLESWLNDSTTVLDQKIRCTHAELKDHLSQLDVSLLTCLSRILTVGCEEDISHFTHRDYFADLFVTYMKFN